MFDSIRETIDYAVENNMSFADIMVKEEMELSGKSRDEVRAPNETKFRCHARRSNQRDDR